MTEEEQSQKINEILTKSWTDTDFKHKLFADTTATLKAEGIEIPEGHTINVYENTGNSLHFVLPPNPNGELSDLELEAVAGGKMGPGPYRGLPVTTRVLPGRPFNPKL